MKHVLTIILLLFIAKNTLACETIDHEFSQILNSKRYIVKGPFTIGYLEKSNLIEIRETKEKLPFGYTNIQWKELKTLYKSGDKFYFVRYESSGRFFSEQHILVRRGCIIGTLMGAIS